MDVGMLWLDDDKQATLEDKVRRAAAYYSQKYGQLPNLCLVNSGASIDKKEVDRIEIRPVQNILPHHFLIGQKTQ